MAVRDVTQIAQPTSGASVLPSKLPMFPEDVVKRFPSLTQYLSEQESWYRRLKSIVGRDKDELAFAVNDTVRKYDALNNELLVQYNDLLGRISTLSQLIIDGDGAVTAYVNQQISAASGIGNKIYIQNEPPADASVNDLWYDLNDGLKAYYWDGGYWLSATDSRLPDALAFIATEATARADGDSANADRITVIESAVNTPSTGLLARISTVESTYATTSSVGAIVVDTIAASILGTGGGTIGAAITTASATQASLTAAVAARTDVLEATVNTPGTGLAARISTVETVKVDADYVTAAIGTAIASASTIGSKVYIQNSAPSSGLTVNDVWYDLDDGLHPYYWNGTSWVDASDTRLTGALAAITTNNATQTSATSAVATRATNLEASVNTPVTGLLARMTTVESTMVTSAGVESTVSSLLSASIASGAPGTIGAALATESTARATFDGQLNATYSIKAIAGNIVTGMRLLSTTGGATDVSAVIFDAAVFRIYNGSSGIPTFDLSGGTLSLNSNIVLKGALKPIMPAGETAAGLYVGSDKMGYWDGAEWKAYITNSGTFEFRGNASNYLLWNGTAFTVRGILQATEGYFGSSAAAVQITAAGLDIGNAGRILGGATAPGAGTGFYLGYSAGAYQFYAGNATNSILWNGSNLAVKGIIRGTSGFFGTSEQNILITANGLDIGDQGRILGGVTGPNVGTGVYMGKYAGAYQLFAGSSAGNKLWWDGSNLTVVGNLTMTGGSIHGGYIVGGTITTEHLNFAVVGSTNVIAMINASTEGGGTLRVQANKLHISGATTFDTNYNPAFKIATGGAATDVNNGATTIVGGKIRSGLIQSETWPASGSLFDLNAGEIHLGGESAPKFSVNSSGIMTCQDAIVKGTLIAGSVINLSGGLGPVVNISNDIFSVGGITITGTPGQASIYFTPGFNPVTITSGTAGASFTIGNGNGLFLNDYILRFQNDTSIVRSGAGAMTMNGAFTASTLTATGTVSGAKLSTTNFSADPAATAVDVIGNNFRVFNGGIQTFRIDFTTGYLYVNGNKVVGGRMPRGDGSLPYIQALLDNWGAWG